MTISVSTSTISSKRPYAITNILSSVPLILDREWLNYDARRNFFYVQYIDYGMIDRLKDHITKHILVTLPILHKNQDDHVFIGQHIFHGYEENFGNVNNQWLISKIWLCCEPYSSQIVIAYFQWDMINIFPRWAENNQFQSFHSSHLDHLCSLHFALINDHWWNLYFS